MYAATGSPLYGGDPMSILILTNRNPGNIYLVNRISEKFEVSGRVMLEAKPRESRDKYKFWMNKVKRYGLAKTINKYLFLKLQGNSADDASVSKKFFQPRCRLNKKLGPG